MLCAIIGFGPGLGAAYAEVFGNAGHDLALLSRSGARMASTIQTGSKKKHTHATLVIPKTFDRCFKPSRKN